MFGELFGFLKCLFGKHIWKDYEIGRYCDRCYKKAYTNNLDLKGISLTGFRALRKEKK